MDKKTEVVCKCGCGQLVLTRGRFYAMGHNPNAQSESVIEKRSNSCAQSWTPDRKKAWGKYMCSVWKNNPKRLKILQRVNQKRTTAERKSAWTVELRRSMSELKKKQQNTPAHRRKMAKVWTLARRRAQAEQQKEIWKNPALLKKHSIKQKALWADPEIRRNKLKGWTTKSRKKQRAKLKKIYKNKKFLKAFKKTMMKSVSKRFETMVRRYKRADGPVKDTKPERLVETWLKTQSIAYEKHGYIKEVSAAGDFYLPMLKTHLLIDGCWWHGHSCLPQNKKLRPFQIRAKKRDRLVTKKIQELGYRLIRVWECQVNKLDRGFSYTLIEKLHS